MAGSKSKRVTLHQKYKIAKRVKEHKRKLKKAMKKNGASGSALWRTKQEANIPNDWPFKDQMLAEIERQKKLEKESEEANRLARKKAQEQKKKDAAEGKLPKSIESALPKGMGAPIAPSAATTNSILLDSYTRRVWREIKQVVEESDIILEVLDARDPLGSRCFEMEEWVSGKLLEKSEKKAAAAAATKKGAAAAVQEQSSKPIILVLNKCDLIPVSVAQQWLDFFASKDHFPALAFTCNPALNDSAKKGQVVSPKELCAGTDALLALINNFQTSVDTTADASNTARKPLKIGIVGYGNVGKSSVLNNLARTHASGVGPIAGYTKELHRFKLAKGLYAIDTPAVPTKPEAPGPHTHLPISNNHTVDDVEGFIQHFTMENLISVLNLKPSDTLEAFLDSLAVRMSNSQMKGGEYNRVAGARKLLKDWNEGKIRFFTPPPDLGEDEEEALPTSGPIQSFFLNSSKKTLQGIKSASVGAAAGGKAPRPEGDYLEVIGSLFDDGESADEDDGEDDEDEEMDGEEDEEDEEDAEMEEDEEEQEELPPPPPTKKGKQAAKSAPVAPAAAPAKPASAKKAAKAAPAPVAAPVAAPAAKQSKKRQQREEESADEEEVEAPAPKKQAAASKANANKPAAAAAAKSPSASAKKGKGKK